MNFRLTHTVSFTGHRTYRYEQHEALLHTIEELCCAGFDTFLCGMAVGFDMAAAEALLEVRRKYPELAIRLVAIVPFRGQDVRYNASDKERYAKILSAADSVVEISQSYTKECYTLRNNFMIDNSAVVVAWYDGGKRSGTHHTVSRAKRLLRRIINLYPQTQTQFEF